MIPSSPYADTSTSVLVPSTSDIISTFYGSGLVGLWLSLFLCGIGVSQAYHYFGQYPKDGICIKSSIILVVLLDCFHSVIECVGSYHYLVSTAEAEDTSVKLRATWTIPIAFVIHLTLACIALLYFTNICYRLLIDKKFQELIIAALVLPILAHLGFGIATVIHISEATTVLQFRRFATSSIVPMLATQVVADVLVSVALCFALPKPSYKQSRGVIHRIMFYAASRGILTSVVALIELMLVLSPDNLLFSAAEFTIPGLYVISFLSAFNSRKALRERLEEESYTLPIPVSTINFRHPRGQTRGGLDVDRGLY